MPWRLSGRRAAPPDFFPWAICQHGVLRAFAERLKRRDCAPPAAAIPGLKRCWLDSCGPVRRCTLYTAARASMRLNMLTSATPLEPGQVPQLSLVTVRKAHDVRTLRSCKVCEQLGHTHSMIDQSLPGANGDKGEKNTRWYHGRCFVAAMGLKALAHLPREQTDRLTIGDLGTRLMRELVAARERGLRGGRRSPDRSVET
jgi:hypothetical protein